MQKKYQQIQKLKKREKQKKGGGEEKKGKLHRTAKAQHKGRGL